ncbi:50S ribosomal protein L31 [Streptomyces sp. NPDC058766]|uniref:50S ribosomal protein L31 n=1 Tax=Streptomyces sp. NPDC058766 TaxID=3346630 RepID=UPI0036964280
MFTGTHLNLVFTGTHLNTESLGVSPAARHPGRGDRRRVEISNVSHPFYTGTARVLDTAGRVERFERRYGRRGAN